MLDIGKIKLGKIIQVDNQPFMVTRAEHHKVARGGAVLKTKLKNLINGAVLDKTFQGNDKAEEADIEKKKVNYLYKDDERAYFMDNDSYEQFEIEIEALNNKEKFLKEGIDVDVLYFQGRAVTMELPIKMEFEVTSSPPGVKGNSAGNVTKQVEIETGINVNAPMFIEKGDIIRVNTDTGEYVERA
ncbi:elongation factor P [bacterium]|nr:elongation factor P [bacterium]